MTYKLQARAWQITNKLFVLTLKQLGVINTKITWCRLYQSQYIEQPKNKPVYFTTKAQKQKGIK